MKYKYLLIVPAFIVAASTFGAAHALEVKADSRENVNINGTRAQVNVKLYGNASTSNDHSTSTNKETTSNEGGNSTSSNGYDNRNDKDNNSTSTNGQGEFNSENHRSTVSAFAYSLINLADREGGIGEQVREVAKSQNDSASTSAESMLKVEERSSFKTFFFGSDYTDLNIIKGELATTTLNIAKLKVLLDNTIDATSRNELSAQIQVLENEQVNLEAYISNHENVFSLFGWFNRFFAK